MDPKDLAPVEDLLKDDDHEKEVRILTKEDLEECFVCYDPLWTMMQVKIHSCKHRVHKKCLQGWIDVGRDSCPFCRGFIFCTTNLH